MPEPACIGSADSSLLGSSGLQDIAAKFGFNSADAVSQLSHLLLKMIDKLTPNGQVPAQGDLQHQLLAELQAVCFRETA